MAGSRTTDAQDQVVWALRALGGQGTLGDLVAVTALPSPEVESALESLIAGERGAARVLDRGDLTYHLVDPGDGTPADPGRAPGDLPRPRRHSALARARRTVFDRRTLRLIRARRGVLSMAELVEQTGLPARDAAAEMRRLQEAWGGEPHVGLDGHTVYAFPELMSSVHGRFALREPRPAWVPADDPMDHARVRDRRARVGVATSAAGAGSIAALPVLAASGLATAGIAAVAAAGGALLAYGVREVLRHHRRFRFRQRDTLRRYALGSVVETALAGKGVVSLERTFRLIQGRAGRRPVSRAAVEAALRELAADFDAPITTQGGDLFFGFRNVKRQFLASHLLRQELALGRTVEGETVFDTSDSPEIASARELEAFDRALGVGFGCADAEKLARASRHGPNRGRAPGSGRSGRR